MNDGIPTYERAMTLLREYNKSDSLLKHAFAVEGVIDTWQGKQVKMRKSGDH